MIIVNLKGGLGNQMFQYACGRAIVLRHLKEGAPVKLKLNPALLKNTPRSYALAPFKIKADLCESESCRQLLFPYGILSKASQKLWRKLSHYYDAVTFSKEIANMKNNSVLEGYFQSEKYFSDWAKEIRQDFSLRGPLGQVAEHIASAISHDHNSVAIHFRKTDYIGHPFLNVCDQIYYEKAIARIREKVGSPRFYVFSDDIAWVKEQANMPSNSIYVSNPNLSDYEEMILMSLCHHNVIANSTFSWWGAWLNTKYDKIVIAPQTWAKGKEANKFRDILPDTWLKV